MQKHTVLFFAAAGLLSSCGVTSAPLVTKVLGVDTIVLGSTPETTTVNGAELSEVVADIPLDNGLFKAWASPTRDKQGYMGQSTSGGSAAFVGGTHTATVPFGGAAYARTAQTILPTTGSTTYTGDYTALVRTIAVDPALSNTNNLVLFGDATLTSNFVADEVSGTITNRTIHNRTTGAAFSNTVADLALTVSALNSDGSYSGTTTGGEIQFYSDTSIDGTYEGLISGSSGQETVGAVRIQHVQNAFSFMETGVFIAQ